MTARKPRLPIPKSWMQIKIKMPKILEKNYQRGWTPFQGIVKAPLFSGYNHSVESTWNGSGHKRFSIARRFSVAFEFCAQTQSIIRWRFLCPHNQDVISFESKGPNTALFGVAHPCGHKFNQKCCNSFSSNNLLTLQGKKQVSNIYKLYHFFN